MSRDMINFFNKRCIKCKLIALYIPTQNGVFEKMIQIIQECVSNMISIASLTQEFWFKEN